MRQFRTLFLLGLLSCPAFLLGQILPGNPSIRTLTKGSSVTFNNPFSSVTSEQVEFFWTGTGGSAVQLHIFGCNSGQPCDTIANISSAADVDNVYPLSATIYSTFKVSGTWTGGSASIDVNFNAAAQTPTGPTYFPDGTTWDSTGTIRSPNASGWNWQDNAAGLGNHFAMGGTSTQATVALYPPGTFGFKGQWHSTKNLSSCDGSSNAAQNVTFMAKQANASNGYNGFCIDDSDFGLGSYVVDENLVARNAAGAKIVNPAAGRASITATTLDSGSSTHSSIFSVSAYADTTVVGSSCAGNTTVALNVISQDPNAAGTTTTVLGTYTITTNGTVGNFATFGPQVFVQKQGVALQYSTTFTANGSCSPAPTVQVYFSATRLK